MLEKGKLSWEVVSVGSFVGLLNPAALGLLLLLGPLPGPALLSASAQSTFTAPKEYPLILLPPSPFHLSLTFLTFLHPLLILTPLHPSHPPSPLSTPPLPVLTPSRLLPLSLPLSATSPTSLLLPLPTLTCRVCISMGQWTIRSRTLNSGFSLMQARHFRFLWGEGHGARRRKG